MNRYRVGPARWAGSGKSPNGHPEDRRIDHNLEEWRSRDIYMLSNLIRHLAEKMNHPSVFKCLQKRRMLSSIKHWASDLLQDVKRTNKALSHSQRGKVESCMKNTPCGVPPTLSCPLPGTAGDTEVFDGRPKPMKPPTRIVAESSDE